MLKFSLVNIVINPFYMKKKIMKNITVKTRLTWQRQCWHRRHNDFKMFPDFYFKSLLVLNGNFSQGGVGGGEVDSKSPSGLNRV